MLHSSEEPQSARQMSASFSKAYDLPNVAYHARVLEKAQLIRLVSERKVRGATEKFLTSNVAEHERVLSILADTAGDDASIRK